MPKRKDNLLPRYPRKWFSWSQYNTFVNKGWMEYCSRYLYGENKENPAMMLGKKVAEMIERDEEQEDEVLEHLRTFLPQYEHKEFEINVDFGGIKLKGFLDGASVIPCPDCGKIYPL